MPSLQTLINESDAIGALGGINLTGDATAVTQPVDDNSTKIATTAYVINQGYLKAATASSTYLTQSAASSTYQVKLVSATNIKTINGTSLLGSGDIEISGGSGGFALTDGDKGDITVSGSGATWTLDNSGVTAGTYNDSATAVRPFTVDAKGRITGVGTAVTITPAWSSIASKPTTLSGFGITDGLTTTSAASTYQPLDADLTAIAGLVGTTGFLKKTAANTWELDTSTYLTTSAAASTYQTQSGMSSYLTTSAAAAAYQALDADLTAIAGLSGTSGFLKKDAANTWSLDTATYLTTASAASTYQTQSGMSSYLTTASASSTYQTILVSGTSIKTINGQSLLGSGDIVISGGGGGGGEIDSAIFINGYAEETYSPGTLTTPITISLTNGSIQMFRVAATAVINFPTPAGHQGKSVTLIIKIASASVILTWTNVTWPGGISPILSSGTDLVDRFVFVCTGSTWLGSTAGQSYASTVF
jgi:hypothetical protein